MSSISEQDLKRDPASLLDRVQAGERLIVSRDGQPVAELRPLTITSTSEPRPVGLAAGAFIVPADFDSALPDELLLSFEQQ